MMKIESGVCQVDI